MALDGLPEIMDSITLRWTCQFWTWKTSVPLTTILIGRDDEGQEMFDDKAHRRPCRSTSDFPKL